MFLEILLFLTVVYFIIWIYTLPDLRTRELGYKIPGPFAFPVIGCVIKIPRNGEEQITRWGEMFEIYGKIWKAWVGTKLYVIICDEGDVEVILSSRTNITKSKVYDLLHPWLGTGLLTSTGEKWYKRRKAITPAFHFSILEQFIDIFNKSASTLVDQLSQYSGQSIDIHPLISKCTLDVISETSMGINPHAQTQKSVYVTAVRKISKLLSERIRTPWLHLDFMYGLLRSHKEVEKTIKILHEHTLKVIHDKKQSMTNENSNQENYLGIKKKIPLLEILLKNENNTFSTDQDIREEVDTFMFEGHDTTASGISFVLSFISKYPQIQDNIYEEVKNILGDKTDFNYEDFQKMKYMERVIKESLRLCPSVPIIGREVTEEVTLKSGYTLPVGSVVLISFYWLHRDEKNFKNPLEFQPDNFLPEEISKRGPFAFVPFSAGPRNCIGQKFAMAEIKSVTSHLILNYILKDGNNDARMQTDLVLQSVNGHNIILKKRICKSIICFCFLT